MTTWDQDLSAMNYYIESYAFTNWVIDKLRNVNITTDVEFPAGVKIFDINNTDNNPETEDSKFYKHKRNIMQESMKSNLNQAIASYNGYSGAVVLSSEFRMPELSETDWDQMFSNVSIVTFLQGLPIGMKYYNNYAIATSTNNKEYVDPDELYFINGTDNYYHRPGCIDALPNPDTMLGYQGYRSIDFVRRTISNDARRHILLYA